MFISIIGTRASGKTSVEQYLVSKLGFQPVRIRKEKIYLHDDYRDREEMINISGSDSLDSAKRDVVPNGNLSTPVPLCFQTATDLLDHVTRNWRELFVSCDLNTPELIEQFIKRPFFLLVVVDAPLVTRNADPNLSLQSFVEEHDASFYKHQQPTLHSHGEHSRGSSLHEVFRLANIHIFNKFSTIADLHEYLKESNLADPDRLRPRWDTYFMTLAALASQRSNCMKRRVGAILVRDKRIVSTGYNGTPRNVRNCNEGGCRRCNSGGPSGEGLDECICLHAEENALLEAGRERVGHGAVLYCNTCPCLSCARKIVQCGVAEVVYNLSYKVDDRTAALFKEAGVNLRQHSPPQ